jgi:Fic family protein
MNGVQRPENPWAIKDFSMTLSLTAGRTYERTHPWIAFVANLELARADLWLLLGEAKSKCEHMAQVTLKPNTAERLHAMYLIKGAAATTAIEGNTLTEDEVAKIRDGTLKLPPSKEYLAIEVENVITTCNSLLQEISAKGGPPTLGTDTIKQFNRQILAGLELEDGVVPGEIRKYDVGIAMGRYRGAPPEDCEYLLARLCEWLNGLSCENCAGIDGLSIAILKAILAHLYLAWIHPFGDGNGRTARLVELLILLSSGVPSPAAHMLSNHYNQTRNEYYRQLQRSSASGGDIIPFLRYALTGFVDGLRSQIGVIRAQQLNTIWREFIYERFENSRTEADTRRQLLILDLSDRFEPVPISDLSKISPRVATAYARRSSRTLVRDVQVLSTMGLLSIGSEGVSARREQILAFLPVSGGEALAVRAGESLDNATPQETA